MEKHYINDLKATGKPIKNEKRSPESTGISNIEKTCQGYFILFYFGGGGRVADGSYRNPRKVLKLSRQ